MNETTFQKTVLHEARLYEAMAEGAVRCRACRQACVIKEGETGVCGIRQNQGGKLYLLTYGRAAAAQIDPIEKKPLYHFLPGTDIFSIGTIGCNFGCSFCQNWDISQVSRTLRQRLRKEHNSALAEYEITRYGYKLLPEEIVRLCVERGIPAVAYTYNEPTIFFEYLYDTALLAAPHGIRSVMVSNGYATADALDMLGENLHAINIDLKAFRDAFYRKQCKARLQPVLDTIENVHQRGIWLELTTLVIPGLNDSEEELRDIAGFIAGLSRDIPWHISAFYPAYQMGEVPPTSRAALVRAYDIGLAAGLRYVYVGNIRDAQRAATYCPGCQRPLIQRRGHSAQIEPAFQEGRCTYCQTKIPGLWK
jgi:pyruvate formate lyase activating enzyme